MFDKVCCTDGAVDPQRALPTVVPAHIDEIRHVDNVIEVQVCEEQSIHCLGSDMLLRQPHAGGSTAVEHPDGTGPMTVVLRIELKDL